MPLSSRRNFLQTIGASFVLDRVATDLLAVVSTHVGVGESGDRGRRFLESLVDPALELLPEYRGSKVYWLFHDNYLASKALSASNAGLADKIRAAIQRFGVDHSGKIEILFGESKQPLPFRQYELIELRRIGEKIVKTEAVKETLLKGWQEYADLLFFAAIAETDREKARQHLNEGLKMWDGTGFKDRVAEKHHQYATYKLALSLIAAGKLRVRMEPQPAIIERLLALQAKDGGWVTDYNPRREPVGLANVETTCLAILGIEAAARTG